MVDDRQLREGGHARLRALVRAPVPTVINVVRGFVEDFYMKVMDDRDAASRLALATHSSRSPRSTPPT